MSAPEVLDGLRRRIASLAYHVTSLPRRFIASQCLLLDECTQLAAAGADAAFDCGVLCLDVSKALEASAEEARVRAAQLSAYAELLEWAVEDAEGVSVAIVAAVSGLLSCDDRAAPAFIGVDWDFAAALCVVDLAQRTRGGVDPTRCIVSGGGIAYYHAGNNHVTVVGVDGEGEAVGSIEADDVTVNLNLKGATVTHVALREAGAVEVVYELREGRVEPVCVSLSVCGAVLPGSPWTIPCLLGDSAILAGVAPERLAAFLRELTVNWLPCHAYNLLYRGSRDGMIPGAFHRLCDGKGPTLVLVRCDQGFVFGGYAGASWDSSGTDVNCQDAFILSVLGPHSPGPGIFPLVKRGAALWCHARCGPSLSGGLTVGTAAWTPSTPFDGTSYCALAGGPYEDVLGKGDKSLTGSCYFSPVEIEVFSVTRT